jgi:hypothetical protein
MALTELTRELFLKIMNSYGYKCQEISENITGYRSGFGIICLNPKNSREENIKAIVYHVVCDYFENHHPEFRHMSRWAEYVDAEKHADEYFKENPWVNDIDLKELLG